MSDEQTIQQQEAENSGSPASRRKKGPHSSVESRKSVNLVLQGKGGVGKSFIASLIAQHFMEAGAPVVCMDTDPVQHSMVDVEALGAWPVTLLDGDYVNVPVMDAVIDRLIGEDSNFVLDNGAASFMPLSSYLLRDGIVDLVHDAGKRVIIHTVIVAGKDELHTGIAARDLTDQFPACAEIVVWLNPFFGSLDGFEETELYRSIAPKLAATIRLPKLDPNYAGRTLRTLLERNMTFAQARKSDDFRTLEKLRLATVWSEIEGQLAGVV